MSYRIEVGVPGRDIEAWSSTRLPFEPRGWLEDFRRDLGGACRTLVAEPSQMLHATYTSSDRRLVDLENVLTYNLGTGAFRDAARYGLLLERSFTAVDDAAHLHHYRYQLVDREHGWRCWAPSSPLATLTMHAPRAAFSNPKAGTWWWHARLGTLAAHQRRVDLPEAFALRIRITPHPQWRGSLASLMKPFTDGLVAALHTHAGPLDGIAERAATIDPALTPTQFKHLLCEPALAPLGRIRLVTTWGATLQWLPADDRIVALDIGLCDDREPGSVTAQAWTARPA